MTDWARGVARVTSGWSLEELEALHEQATARSDTPAGLLTAIAERVADRRQAQRSLALIQSLAAGTPIDALGATEEERRALAAALKGGH